MVAANFMGTILKVQGKTERVLLKLISLSSHEVRYRRRQYDPAIFLEKIHERLFSRSWILLLLPQLHGFSLAVIPGHPTLARVVVAGTFFILAAVIAGLFLFFYIYCRHKDEYADLEEGLLSRRRCFKPQLEDVEAGLPTYKTTPAVPFRRAPLRTFWRTEKEDEDSDNSDDDDSYTRRKKTFQGLALKKKAKGDHKKKKDGETSKKDNKSSRKTEKLQKTTEGTSKREDKNVKKSEEYKQAKPAKQERKRKILKEIKMAKRPKLKKLKTTMLKENIKTKIRRKKR
ncbi:uncharacterized protein [Dendrobates tinctorius]|uniref:uncharacterized protein n=1 Tax=Dendrobates tinctorius TaxID=92724 RepID=UPI003CCA5602